MKKCISLLFVLYFVVIFVACSSQNGDKHETSSGITAINTPSKTLTAIATTIVPTATPVLTQTPSFVPTSIPTPISTQTPTQSSTPISTPTQIVTPTPTSTPTKTLPSLNVNPFAVEKKTMPRIDIVTENNASITSKEVYVNSTISVSGCDEQYEFTNKAAGIRVRGNSTSGAAKKPYRIKFNTKQSMLGLNDGKSFKDWCLLADYLDASMLRNWTAFNFAEVLLEGKYYSSDCIHVEVYVNGSYAGVYLLCEQTEIKKNRVNIYEKEDGETSLQIGYLLVGSGVYTDEDDHVLIDAEIAIKDRDGKAISSSNVNFSLSGSGYTQEQINYVDKYVTAALKVVHAAVYENQYYTLHRDGTMSLKTNFKGQTEQERQIETISAVFDIESAVRMCVLDEIVRNLDVQTFNLYVDLSPSGDGTVRLAVPWDYDLSMGVSQYSTNYSTNGYFAMRFTEDLWRHNVWLIMLGNLDWFEEMVKDVWQAHYSELVTIAMDTLVMSYSYSDAFGRDYSRWNIPINRWYTTFHNPNDLASFDTHIKAGKFLNTWLIHRLDWLNQQWGADTTPLIEQSNMLYIDFTKNNSISYLGEFNNCKYDFISDTHIKVTATDSSNAYFYIDYTNLPETFLAEDYQYVEIEYRLSRANTLSNYSGRIYFLSGNVSEAKRRMSSPLTFGAGEQLYKMTRISLEDATFWKGKINKLRIDFFGNTGDAIYIRSVKLLKR